MDMVAPLPQVSPVTPNMHLSNKAARSFSYFMRQDRGLFWSGGFHVSLKEAKKH